MARRKCKVILGFALALLSLPAAHAADLDIGALFDRAEAAGRVGIARKTKLVDGRSAHPGEVIVTVIKGEGKETQSAAAEAGDVVIRNRCPATGNEQYLVEAARLPSRYDGPLAAPDATGWQPYRPKGIDVRFFSSKRARGRSPSPPPGARRWSHARATRSFAIQPIPKTLTASPPPLSSAPTKSWHRPHITEPLSQPQAAGIRELDLPRAAHQPRASPPDMGRFHSPARLAGERYGSEFERKVHGRELTSYSNGAGTLP